MIYTQLQAQYKYDTLAEAIYQREVEWFHYDFDLKNFQTMIATMPDGFEKETIQKRINETHAQMMIVENIYNALLTQIDDQAAYDAAVVRAQAKRAAQ